MSILNRASAIVSMLCIAPASRTDVLRVSPGSYPTPQAAIDAAGDGDLILVDAGVYPGFVSAAVAMARRFKAPAFRMRS